MFNIINSMYQNTKNKIKFKNGISETFTLECVVKQGDILSTSLFDILLMTLLMSLKQAIVILFKLMISP
jgi:hypothetical protein